jgi:copper chaperone CopZ
MTQLDVMYLYGAAPSETAMKALGQIRKVYGIRLVDVDETAKTVRVEYDATRLTEPIVHQLLRRSGIDVIERVSLIPPQPEPAAAAPAAS